HWNIHQVVTTDDELEGHIGRIIVNYGSKDGLA
ncbi:MAG: hypothetical protein ACJARM_000429, partial [Glaciecola sp.]